MPLFGYLAFLTQGLCAQVAGHSFRPAGVQLPLCARDTGLFLAFFLTLAWRAGRGARGTAIPRPGMLVILGCGPLAMLVDGLNSLAADLGATPLYPSGNALRLLTGLAAGVAAAEFALPLLNAHLRGSADPAPSLAGPGDLAPGLAASLAVAVLAALGGPLGLVVLAPLSVAAALGLLALVNLLAWAALGWPMGPFSPIPPRWQYAAALALSASQLIGLAALRGALLPEAL